MVKMREKLELLKEGVFVMTHILKKMPEIEIITDGGSQYYVDSEITKIGTDIELYTNTYPERATIYLSKNIDFYTGENIFFTKRIYSKEVFNYELCSLKHNTISFKEDYYDQLIKVGINTKAMSEIQLKIVELISKNKYYIDKDSVPNRIKKLLPFI